MNNNIGIDIIKEQISNNKKATKVKQKNISKIVDRVVCQSPIQKIKSSKKNYNTEQRKSDHSKNQFHKECKNIKNFVSKL